MNRQSRSQPMKVDFSCMKENNELTVSFKNGLLKKKFWKGKKNLKHFDEFGNVEEALKP